MNKAAKLVSSALLGIDVETVIVGGEAYVIMPPTIERIAGAAQHFPDVEDADNLADVVRQMKNAEAAAAALAWFVCPPKESTEAMRKAVPVLANKLARASLEEVLVALATAYSLIDIRNFLMLSALAKSVGRLTANPRQK